MFLGQINGKIGQGFRGTGWQDGVANSLKVLGSNPDLSILLL